LPVLEHGGQTLAIILLGPGFKVESCVEAIEVFLGQVAKKGFAIDDPLTGFESGSFHFLEIRQLDFGDGAGLDLEASADELASDSNAGEKDA
jgi:hypothetical protein